MIRKLSPELQDKAIREVNEDPSRIEEQLKNVRAWIQNNPKLTVVGVVEDQWILCFLRGCKYDLERVKEKVENFCKAKVLYPHFMRYENPLDSKYQHIIEQKVVMLLPHMENSLESRIILVNYDNYDINTMSEDDLSAVFFMYLSILMIESDDMVISGVKILVDAANFPLRCLLKYTPTYLKSAIFCLIKSFPIRLQGIYAINMNYLFEVVFRIFKALMPKKLKERVLVISKSNNEHLYKYTPQKCLPYEYGGENSTVEEIMMSTKKKIESYANLLKSEPIVYNNKK